MQVIGERILLPRVVLLYAKTDKLPLYLSVRMPL